MTVASLATITHSRPDTRPIPVMMPAPGASSSYMPSAASGDSSRNGEAGSSSPATRSRGSSLPRAVCRSLARCGPPRAATASRSLSSPARASFTLAFCWNTGSCGSASVPSRGVSTVSSRRMARIYELMRINNADVNNY